MTKRPTFVRETTQVREAMEVLHMLDVRHLPVVNAENEVVGMLSDRDLREVRSDGMESRVAAIMTGNVITLEEEDDVEDAVELMLENRIGAVPVVDGEGVLVGILSYVDLLRAAHFG